ncbi:hypothetical protein JXL19_07360 [bacterium]|nr:hypothetical protein [bacterium]
MSHIFFEKLEKRQSTQSLLPTFGSNTGVIAIYSAQLPDSGWGSTGYTPSYPSLLYGINIPSYPGTGSYFPWSGSGLFGGAYYNPWSGGGLFGWSGYTPWTNPFNSYNPWGSWGSGSFFSPFQNFFGGLFGGLFGGSPWGYTNPITPDFRLLYGVFPNPQPVYGVSVTPPGNIVAYYGVAVPEYAVGIPY